MPKFIVKKYLDSFLKLYGQVPADSMFDVPMMDNAYPPQNESQIINDKKEELKIGGEDERRIP